MKYIFYMNLILIDVIETIDSNFKAMFLIMSPFSYLTKEKFTKQSFVYIFSKFFHHFFVTFFLIYE